MKEKWLYNWPLNNVGLNYTGPLSYDFFFQQVHITHRASYYLWLQLAELMAMKSWIWEGSP